MNPAISGLYAVTPDLVDTAVFLANTQAALTGGGITLDNAAELIDAGAAAIAVISALYAAPDTEAAARKSCQLLRVKVA